jgi:cell fate regulator YaaT (PSP1 superfamily)
LENIDNNKKNPEGGTPSESKGNMKPSHKRHHHNRNKQNKPQKPAEAAEQAKSEASAPAETPAPVKQSSGQSHKNNRNKKHHNRGGQQKHHEQETAPVETAPAPEQKAPVQNKSRNRQRDRQKTREPAELLTSLPENELDFLPSRSKSESDFLSLGKTDDSYLDSMPLDPTLDAVFAEVPAEEKKPLEGPEIIGIRFEHGSKVYYFDPKDKKYSLGDHAIVETAQGLEYGEVVISNRIVAEDQIVAPLRPVIRRATKEDEAHHEDNRRRQNEAFKICLTKIADHGLDMKLVDCQYTFDNTKLIFFFTSAGRVDFRALVKDLASVFRTRIELRQIGIRDEARMVGGFGVCGRKLCCAGFLPNFVQVSIKMAKEQGLSINAAKISGTCGRLMCCLRYEQEAYEREIALMPPVDSVVDTPDGRGTVIDIFPIAGNLKVKLHDKQDAAPKNYHMSTIRVITKAESQKNSPADGE